MDFCSKLQFHTPYPDKSYRLSLFKNLHVIPIFSNVIPESKDTLKVQHKCLHIQRAELS